MNKAQIVEELASRFEGNRKQAQFALESVIDVIQRALVKGEKVGITGFGSFEKVDRPARMARNPATGASVKVKKTSVPRFRPGTELKAVVSGQKKLPKLTTATAAGTATTRGKAAKAATTGTAATKGTAAKGAAAKVASAGSAAKSAARTAVTTAAKTAKTAKTAPKATKSRAATS